jgi:DNA/RNA endonuclease G (NUC1)
VKKCLILLLGLLSVSLSAQLRDSVNFNTPYFDIWYSETLEQPIYAYYRVVCPTSTTSRSGMDFYTEPKLHTSDDADYVNNVWDKGHLAPVGSIRCDKDMVNATFSYANCALQHYRLNRGVWRSLEAREQRLAQQYEEVYVKIRVVFDDNPVRLETNAAIPIGFYKTIQYGSIFEKYYFPNTEPVSKDIYDYRIIE